MTLVVYWFCVVIIAVCFVAWKNRYSREHFSTTVVRKWFHVLALAIYIPGVVCEPYVTHLASSVAVAAFIFVEVICLKLCFVLNGRFYCHSKQLQC